MISQIDGYHIAAQIRLLRQTHKGAILMLEGETDAKVFDRFVDGAQCTTEVCFGKPNLLHALELLEDQGFSGVLAMADLDYDDCLNVRYNLDNLYQTDCHDLDLTIFLSPALKTYLAEHAEKNLFAGNFNSDEKAIRKAIFDACHTLGQCRLVSERHRLKLDFKDLGLDKFITESNLQVDVDALLTEILRRSCCYRSLNDLKAFINFEVANGYPPEHIVSGHDAAEVLGIALRRLIANRKVVHTWGSEIESGLRIAFDWATFSQTSCLTDLRDWEARNAGYRVLPI